MPTYCVIITGVKPGVDTGEVAAKLSDLFKIPGESAAWILSSGNCVVKNGVDFPTADKYRQALDDCGAVVQVEQESSSNEVALTETTQSDAGDASGASGPASFNDDSTSGIAADQKYCFSCRQPLHFSAANCPHCGATQPGAPAAPAFSPAGASAPTPPVMLALPPNHVFCRGCGRAVHETAQACPQCGAVLGGVSPSGGQGSKSRIVAAVLAFCLGGLGAHKFYLGSIGMGILYLLFFWTGIPAIVALIEGILYLTKSDDEFRRRYG